MVQGGLRERVEKCLGNEGNYNASAHYTPIMNTTHSNITQDPFYNAKTSR